MKIRIVTKGANGDVLDVFEGIRDYLKNILDLAYGHLEEVIPTNWDKIEITVERHTRTLVDETNLNMDTEGSP